MKKKSCLWLGLLFVLIVVCMVAGALVYLQTRPRTFNSRPLVLIHDPINHTQFQAGDGVLVHATIRAEKGLTRAELWADDVLVDTRAVPGGSPPTSLVFSTQWIASVVGNHALIVRAFAADGSAGQASIVVEVVNSEDATPQPHVVQEGETLESIASDYGITPQELAASNSNIGTGGITPGDELVIPGDEPLDTGGDDAPVEWGEPPDPEDAAPDTPAVDLGFSGILESFNPPQGDPTGLRVEFLSMTSGAAYESLHCYIGVGSGSPQWYPDADNNQTTDESFILTDTNSSGLGTWSIEDYLSAENAPTIFWPPDRDLPVSVSCVGITAGGTEALELGRWEDNISPERWTGMTYSGGADGADGSFEFSFRITRLGGRNGGIPIYLDTSMTPPTNARIDDRRISLRWDYEPPTDEEPISGFRIYLNDNLQWVETADSRESGLPYEWMNPPCDSTYNFKVTAYRIGLPDGPESMPAVAMIQPLAVDCQREIQISFLTLETSDLGGDGDEGDRHGDIGPPFGTFFANEQQISFDGGDLGSYGVDMPNGFSHNTIYDLAELAADSTWRFNGMPSLVVEIPEGGTFEFGYNIMDEDSGDCDDSGDPGCDDLICEGLSMIYDEDSSSNNFNSQNEDALSSEDGRCRVTYRWGPAPGSPVGSGVPGGEPLPWIDVENFDIDKTTGQVRINIRNTGTATWPWRDLDVELRSRDGSSLGVYTYTDFVLEAGQRTVLESPQMRVDAPFDACVMIDPYDNVLEEYERSGSLYHGPICPRLPDLTINDVKFDSSGGGRLLITVQNIGDGMVENRTLNLQTFLADGSPAYLIVSDTGVNMASGEVRVFDIPGVTESARSRLVNGYSVVVNGDNSIPESSAENNSFSLSPYQFRIWADCSARIPHYHGLGSEARIFTTADVISGPTARTVLELNRTSTLSSTETYSYGYDHIWHQGNMGVNGCTDDNPQAFNIMGDESLRISIHADFRAGSYGDREDLGTATEIFGADRYSNFPVQTGSMLDTYCVRYTVSPPLGNMLLPESWFDYICIARVEP